MEKERVVELLAGGVFVALLLIIALLVVGSSQQDGSKTVIISNSFNTYAYSDSSSEGHGKDAYYRRYYDADYGKTRYRSMDYDDFSRNYIDRGLLGNDIKRNYVYVKNLESQGGYFTVRFYFRDDYGRTKTESMTKHIDANGVERFSYTGIYDDDYRYWKYSVAPESKVPAWSR